MAVARGGQLWCVFGCGGDRDATKRPLMGAIAAQRADRLLVTSDNPRSEAPQAILDQIVAGVPGGGASLKLGVEVDRRLAILEALAGAAPQDVILIAGKGHEDYQEIAGVKHPFSDVVIASAALSARGHA
jgi:UDP-N-acetylmuramyl tripeptide synthase